MKATKLTPKTSASKKADAPAKQQAASTSTKKTSTRSAAGAGANKPKSADPKTRIRDYRQMLLVRDFELRAGQAYTQAKIGGYCHLNLGEEATVVGVTTALGPNDYLYGGYRFHGYALGRGLDAGAVMAELFGRTTGVSKGRGGSMHLFDAGKRVMGGYGIVGGQIPLATGAAFGIDYRSEAGPDSEAVVCLLGDGATNIGAFHESLNIASLWNLPIVYVVVNNQLGMGTTVEHSSAEPEIYKKAAAYRIRGERVDGNSVDAVRDAMERALKEAREQRRPVVVEAMSFRLRGHSVVDPARYRSKEEVDHVKSMDPLPHVRASLLDDGVIAEDELIEIEKQVADQVAAAVKFADSSPHPTPDELFEGVYATEVANEPDLLPGAAILSTSGAGA